MARLILFVGLLLFPLSRARGACPGCKSVLTPTWSERFARSDVALLARWVGAKRRTAGKNVSATTTFEVLQIARDSARSLKKGQHVVLPKLYDGSPGDLFLLVGNKPEKKDGKSPSLKWDPPTQVSESAYFYVTQSPSPEQPVEKRLKFFLKFFEFPDPLVADDAYNEFAKAPFKEIKAIAGAFPRKKLRHWLTDPDTPQTRIGLYGLMLGLCGTTADAALLKKLIADDSKEFRLGIEGVIAGYLMLVGEPGVDLIDRTKLKDEKVGFGETYMAVQGLRIVDNYGDGKIGRDRLKKSLRILLDRPKLVEIILPDLARWKDWSIMERLMAMYGKKGCDSLGFRKSVIRFLLAARNDAPKSAKQTPPHVAAAKKYLDRLRKQDPQAYRYAVQTLF